MTAEPAGYPEQAGYPQRKKRRRGVGWIVLAGVLVLLVAAFFVVDSLARSYAANLIDDKVHSALKIPASQPVDVSVAGVSVIAQLLTGKLERVTIDAHDLAVGPLSGDVTLAASGIPIDQSKPIDSAELGFSVGQKELEKLVAPLSTALKLPLSSVGISHGAVDVSAKFAVLGLSIPVTISFTPSAVGGQLALEPKTVEINGAKFTPKDLGNVLGSAGASLANPQKVCVASLLPKGFVLESIRVSGNRLVLAVSARSVTLDSSLLSTFGTCATT
ncbi:MAG: hypothetical protein JWO10_492 [Microbacteriaceae bacterium]|nr:hypothetical protein [Microbacteriaceae bacterium]